MIFFFLCVFVYNIKIDLKSIEIIVNIYKKVFLRIFLCVLSNVTSENLLFLSYKKNKKKTIQKERKKSHNFELKYFTFKKKIYCI